VAVPVIYRATIEVFDERTGARLDEGKIEIRAKRRWAGHESVFLHEIALVVSGMRRHFPKR
jgi:hypothetical protein